jgi:hypothetical protein
MRRYGEVHSQPGPAVKELVKVPKLKDLFTRTYVHRF